MSSRFKIFQKFKIQGLLRIKNPIGKAVNLSWMWFVSAAAQRQFKPKSLAFDWKLENVDVISIFLWSEHFCCRINQK